MGARDMFPIHRAYIIYALIKLFIKGMAIATYNSNEKAGKFYISGLDDYPNIYVIMTTVT